MNEIPYVSGAIDSGDCVGRAWTLVTRRFWLYVGAGLVTILLISCIPVVNWLVLGPAMGGFYYIVLTDLRDEPVEFGMLFKGFEKFLPLMIAGLVQSAPGIVATVIQYTVDIATLVGTSPGVTDVNFYQPSTDSILAGMSSMALVVVIALSLVGIVWTIALSFAVPLIIEHDIGVGEALITSVKGAGNNIGGLILLVILEILVMLLGMIALCIGVFVAVPVVYAANAVAYRYVFPYVENRNFNTGPPPPAEYGGTYGTGYTEIVRLQGPIP